jgi:hypothetical protein
MVTKEGLDLEDLSPNLGAFGVGGSLEEQLQVRHLLQEFNDVFQELKPGEFVVNEPVRYDLKPGWEKMKLFKRQRPFLNVAAKEAMAEILDKLIDTGRVEICPTQEPQCCSNILAVIDKFLPDGSAKWRLVIDARHINQAKVANRFPKTAPVNIYHMDDSLPIYVIADASKVGWSCCGYQIRGDSYNPEDKSLPDPKPRELKDEEVQLTFLSTGGFANASFNWQINRKECYSFYAGITKNRDKIGGRPFILFTDHKNFTYLTENSSEMVQRWLIALQQFRFWAVHIPGKDNPDADALSRIITVLDDRNVSLDCTIIWAV